MKGSGCLGFVGLFYLKKNIMELEMLNNGKEDERMSSREIAEITGKRHDHVLRDCDKLNENYEKLGLPKIGEGYFTTPNTGETKYREFLLNKIQSMDLMTGYNIELRIKVNRRWEELERKQNGIPQNFSEALKLAYEQSVVIENQQKSSNEAHSEPLQQCSVVGSASFVCKNCNHELPKTFSVKTDQYCYLCDPKVTLEDCLQKDYPKTWKK